jgi:hypothetical protein
MFASRPRRLALLFALAVPVAVPSAAGAATLQVDFPSPDIVEAQPTPLHIVASGRPRVDLIRIVAKPLTPGADSSRGPLFDQSDRLFDTNDDINELTTAAVFDRAGRWLVCGWAGGLFDDARAEQVLQVAVRPPHARIAVQAPARARVDRSVRVSFAFDVEVPRRLLYSVVRGTRCGRGADVARARRARVTAVPDAIVASGWRSVGVRFPGPGRWRVCAYVQRNAGPGEANAVAGADVSAGRGVPRRAPQRGRHVARAGAEFGR